MSMIPKGPLSPLERLEALNQKAEEGGGPDRVAKQHAAG